MNKQVFVEQKREEYKDDEVLLKFLTSNKSDEYKYSIIKLLETDYIKCTYDGPSKKNREKIYNKELAMKLDEINFKKMKQLELIKLAENLWIRNYANMSKQELIEKIENVKSNFKNK